MFINPVRLNFPLIFPLMLIWDDNDISFQYTDFILFCYLHIIALWRFDNKKNFEQTKKQDCQKEKADDNFRIPFILSSEKKPRL